MTNSPLRTLLNNYRTQTDTSLRELAVESGVNYQAIHDFLNGKDLAGRNLSLLLSWLLREKKEKTNEKPPTVAA